jgi:hypothetical protein
VLEISKPELASASARRSSRPLALSPCGCCRA